ncbi:MFS general substrate transporter [Aspergillus sclerotiicarbonarius CBS 121057]|uniref:MFS general substrate transporter n=1 Tax=Aspergillus sclerotiicarbonarius (strain CBS 121057 / IBT 28362) TaxID=1448318 RepID=A0A319FAY3_ASPSB|nr:MFS general substrate transporter [Aspergillus sclerotiicarbonarius CBS 121057]
MQPEHSPGPLPIVELDEQDSHQIPGEWPEPPTARRELGRAASRRSRTSRLSRRLSVSSDIFQDAIESQGYGAGVGSRRISGVFQHSLIEGSTEELGPKELTEQLTVEDPSPTPRYGPRIWAIMVALCVTNLLVALEGTVISTALPTIVDQLGGGEEYVWASTGYFLTNTVFQPLYGQMADIFGRRWLIMYAVAMFVLGSGISGGAASMNALIAGRVIQGIGGGGITLLVNLIVCDLVPLRERGRLMAIVFAAVSVGTSLGPIVGGLIVERTTWRWVFYLNLPVGGISMLLLFVFLQVGHRSEDTSIKRRLKQIDYGGNLIFILAISFILVALAYGGTLWPWGSYSTIVSLVFGFYGVCVFVFYEQSHFCRQPTLPMRLFSRRTSATAFTITFLQSMLTLLVIYVLPVYFQAVLLASPIRSGVMMLPTVLVLVPASVVSGALLSRFGRYKPFHFLGFALFTLGFGCFITLDASSPDVAWIMVQFVVAVGSGCSLSTLLPAVQAEFSDQDTAAATAAWAFVRQFGVVWGVSVPSAIFNAQVEHYLPRISSQDVRQALSGGAAYEHGTKEYIASVSDTVREQVMGVYSDSLQVVWMFATVISGIGLLLVFLEREIPLRTQLETKYGLTERGGDSSSGE